MVTEESHWVYKENLLTTAPEGIVGFVYCITNVITRQKYIGKKLMVSKVTKPPLKGRKNKRRSLKESDWKTYTSSSKYVNESIEEYGIDNFHFEIITMHTSRGEVNYNELRCQILNDVLESRLENGERAYFNENINLRYYSSEKFNEERIAIKDTLLLN